MADSNIFSNLADPLIGMSVERLKHSLKRHGDKQLRQSALLRNSIDHLLTRHRDWQSETKLLASISLEIEWMAAPPDLNRQGNVTLFKTNNGELGALVWEAGHWNLLDADGKTRVPPHKFNTQIIESVQLRLPVTSTQADISGMAAMADLLKTAWIEIGIGSLIINVGMLLLPLFSMLVYDKVVNNGVFETLWALTIGMLIYIGTDISMRLIRAWSMENLAHQLSRNADQTLWQKILHQAEFRMGFSRLLTYYRDLSVSRDFISSYYLLALVDMPFLLLYLVAMAVIAWPLAITTIILVICYTVLSHLVQRQLTAASKQVEQIQASKLSFLSESLQSLDMIKTSPRQRHFEHQWQTLSSESALQDARRRYTGNMSNLLASTLSTLTSVTILVVGAYLIDAKLLTVGGLIASNLLASRAMSIVTAFYTVFGKWQDFKRASSKLDVEISNKVTDQTVSRTQVQGDIQIINASKTYAGHLPCLQNIRLQIQSGERVALLGKPGAGKTTLLRALSGLVKLDQGSILIDGLDSNQIAQHDRSLWLAWKGQEPSLFAGTLEENLLVSGMHVNSPELQRAIWITGLDDEFKSGKLSLGMSIDERGSNLSGGQRQKIALARALAQPAKIVLLDEPTQGLDPDTERAFAQRLQQALPADTTLIMSTHSTTLLSLTQRVIALDQGRVIADGPTEKLLAAQT